MNKYLTIFGLALLISVAGQADAQLTFGDSGEPIIVDAEKATYKGNLTLLTGNVDVRQGTAHIKSDEMEIYREKNAADAAGNLSLGAVTRIVAIGKFSYRTPGDVVTGDKGVYDRKTGIITVTGNVSVGKPGSSRLSGEKLVYDLETKRAKVGAGEGRVGFSIKKRKN